MITRHKNLELLSQQTYNNLKEWHCTAVGIFSVWPYARCRRLKDGRIACLLKKAK